MMKNRLIVAFIILCSAMMLTWGENAQSASQSSTASGSLTLNNKEIKLTHAYVDMVNPEEPIVVLSDKPLPPEDFSISILSETYIREKKVHAVLFSLSPMEKKLSGSLNFFYFPGNKTHFVALGDQAVLTITQFDDTTIAGQYKTSKPIVEGFSEVTLSFDATFQVKTGKSKAGMAPLKKIIIKGDTSLPARVYVEYYKSCLEGNLGKGRDFMAERERKEFDRHARENREALLYLFTQRPSEVRISTPAISGNTASITVHGSIRLGEEATGSIKMVLEGGQWKVSEDKWTITGK